MNIRSATLLLALALLLGVVAPSFGQDDHPTCSETSDAVLAPYLANLEAAELARVSYDDQSEARRRGQLAEIEKLEWTSVLLERLEQSTVAGYEHQLELAREAIVELRKRDQSELARLRVRVVEERSHGREKQALEFEKIAADLAAELAAGERSIHQGELGFSRTQSGWEQYIAERSQALAKARAEFAAGTVGVRNPKLGYNLSRLQTDERIAEVRLAIAETVAHKLKFQLPSLGVSLTGEGVDELLQRRRNELALARSEIQAGTFKVRVPTLGLTTDRNAVQGLIADAKQVIRKTRESWAAGTYAHYHYSKGYKLTNGGLDKQIADKAKEIVDSQAQGDEFNLHVPEHGGLLSGSFCEEKRQQASEQGDAAQVAHWDGRHAAWQAARTAWVEAREEQQAGLEADLVEHKRLFDETIDTHQTYLDTSLTWALGETPCGGSASVDGDPLADKVAEHLATLRSISESEEEAQRRTDEYQDKVHVEQEGTVHGDVKDAWEHALRDTELTRPDTPESSVARIKQLKDLTDYLSGFAGLHEMAEASARIQAFIDAIEALDPNAADFFEQRRNLRTEYFDGLEEMIEKGLLSDNKISELLKALKGSGSGSLQAGLVKQRLRLLRVHASSLRGDMLSPLRTALEAGEGFGDAMKARFRFLASRSMTQLAGGWAAEGRSLSATAKASWKNASSLDKGLVFLSVAAAAADVVEKTEGGMATSEAIARASVGLAIEFAIAGFPITAAAEMGTQILFHSMALATGDQAYSDATLENTSKWVAEQAFDGIAAGAARLGNGWVVMTRALSDEPGMAEILANVDFAELRRSLSYVEDRLDALAPGDPGEADLLRMRQTFRELIRAIQQGG